MSVAEEICDVTLIGGGPIGMFGMFYAGVRDMQTRLLDALPELGGQLSALYPEKFIYDVLGFPRVLARDLVASCKEQALQFGGQICLGERVEQLRRRPDGILEMVTPRKVHLSRSVIITAGVGAFAPRRLDVPNAEKFEGRGLFYFVTDKQLFAKKRVIIVGGGDSAVDWALNLQDTASNVTLLHRRSDFRAHEGTVSKLMNSSARVMTFHEVKELHGRENLEAVTVFDNRTGEETCIPCDRMLLTLGFQVNIGPIKDWGLTIDSGGIVVNTSMETNMPGVFAAGDICSYKNKLKLIAVGAGEVTTAVCFAKQFIDPTASIFPGHSSTRMGK